MEPRFFDISTTHYADGRGWVAFFMDRLPIEVDLDPASIHLVHTRPGQVRGNHLHPQAAEWLYLFSGRADLFWDDGSQGLGSRRLEADQTLVLIPAGVAHALLVIGPDPAWLVAVRERPIRPALEHTIPAGLIDAPRI